ncbi:MAG: SpoIIE family protein phosphatase [Fluviicola sp.]|nr:SpoIIE family protein phosphatase [Fluviicola sp.]
MRLLLLLYFIFTTAAVFGQEKGVITLTDENIGTSFTQQILILEDKSRSIEIDDIVAKKNSAFYQLDKDNPSVKFATSRFWVKFSVKNESDVRELILETARPITDKVFLYQIEDGKVIQEFVNGDDFNYYKKDILHRKNLFPLELKKGKQQEFILEISSGGEGINIPLRIHSAKEFYQQDYKDQFRNGFYYGVMCLIIVIYFFFFLLLKDRTFLFYILYVLFQALLQFSLDGYAHQHFFINNAYWVNRFPPFAGAMAIIFMLVYVNHYLSIKNNYKRFHTTYKVAGILMILSIIFLFSPGKMHAISYPLINAFSLLSILLSVISIFYLRSKKVKVDNYFTLAFVILISGAVIFILGNFGVIKNSTLSLNSLKISSVLEVVILSISMSYKYRELQKDKEEAQAIVLKNLQERNAFMDAQNVKLEQQVVERTAEINLQKEELAVINDEVFSSIKYAKRIQEAILPSDEQVKKLLPDSFILNKPKDVVSGDFYFVEKTTSQEGQECVLFAAVDCTGHGVPGAFMSIVGSNLLSQAVLEKNIHSPAKILDFLNEGVNATLKQNLDNSTVRDGMDMALCALSKDFKHLVFSGAKNPIYIIRASAKDAKGLTEKQSLDGLSVYEIKGDKHPIGKHADDTLEAFSEHVVDLQKGDLIYIFSDGYADQFGGERNKKFNYRRFRELLMKISPLEMTEQSAILEEEFEKWRGMHLDILRQAQQSQLGNQQEQVDDVLVIGVRVT